MKLLYKLSKSVIPMFGLTLSIGMCYAFSVFSKDVTCYLQIPADRVQFAFCLNILMLGLGAAAFGRLIERRIKPAAWLSCGLFACGMALSGLAMHIKNEYMFFIGFGLFCGVAEGIGYVTPVLNNILWFRKNRFKGVIAAMSIVSFGLGSALCVCLRNVYFPVVGIENLFFALGATYFVFMAFSATLINKPRWAQRKLNKDVNKFDYVALIGDPYARKSWMYMFLNISAGLVLIGMCKPILGGIMSQDLSDVIMVTCGISNGAGRLIFPALSDFMKRRVNMLLAVLGIEIAVIAPVALNLPFAQAFFVAAAMIVINATYGSFFALLPSILSDHYGNENLSTRHSAILSAWGIASVFAHCISVVVIRYGFGINAVMIALAAIYSANFLNVLGLRRIDNCGIAV